MSAREGGAEIARCAQFLGDLRQRTLVGADVFGQPALWRVAAEERSGTTL